MHPPRYSDDTFAGMGETVTWNTWYGYSRVYGMVAVVELPLELSPPAEQGVSYFRTC